MTELEIGFGHGLNHILRTTFYWICRAGNRSKLNIELYVLALAQNVRSLVTG